MMIYYRYHKSGQQRIGKTARGMLQQLPSRIQTGKTLANLNPLLQTGMEGIVSVICVGSCSGGLSAACCMCSVFFCFSFTYFFFMFSFFML